MDLAHKGYIYIRSTEWWDVDGVCKLGKTKNIPEREGTYITGEFKNKGAFYPVFEVSFKELDIIEQILQNEFHHLHRYKGAGTEFYAKSITELIEPYLNTLNIKYKRLSRDDIDNLVRCKRVKKPRISTKALIRRLNNIYTPRSDQTQIIKKSVNYFKQYDKGILVLMCGVGKTLISLWITQKMNCITILIGVPNMLLLNQWKNVVQSLFHDTPYLIVSGGVDVSEIEHFLKKNKKSGIIVTTYASSHKVCTAVESTKFLFDMKILDEVHHLTAINMENTTKKYVQILNIPSKKQLALTATIKNLEGAVVSNDNVEYFGEIIERKCLLWAINQNIVCDYVIQTIITDGEQLSVFEIDEENDKRLFLGAFAALKSISQGHSHHLLIYSNNLVNSSKIVEYINALLINEYFDIPGLYYSNYHSEMKLKDQKEIIGRFGNAEFGIITCVYCLGEGWDFPLLDGVVFAENMTSNIRIVQSALRASRINKLDMTKKTKIILPILDRSDWLENSDNTDLRRVREVVYQMGLEDETIGQKIKVYNIRIEKSTYSTRGIQEYGEYNSEVTEILLLKTVRRSEFLVTYEKARKILVEKSIKSKAEYFALSDIRLPQEPETAFKSQFTNWIDYLSIPRIYYDLDTCKMKVSEYLSENPEIQKHHLNLLVICNKLCCIDPLFPPNELWADYYGIKELKYILIMPNKKKSSGVSF